MARSFARECAMEDTEYTPHDLVNGYQNKKGASQLEVVNRPMPGSKQR